MTPILSKIKHVNRKRSAVLLDKFYTPYAVDCMNARLSNLKRLVALEPIEEWYMPLNSRTVEKLMGGCQFQSEFENLLMGRLLYEVLTLLE